VRDDRVALDRLLGEISVTLGSDVAGFEVERDLLRTALADFDGLTTLVVTRWRTDDGRAVAAQDCTRVLLSLGDLVIGWLSLRGCVVAQAALAGASGSDRDFYLGKVAAGRWFIRNVLPQISAGLTAARHAGADFLDLPASAL